MLNPIIVVGSIVDIAEDQLNIVILNLFNAIIPNEKINKNYSISVNDEDEDEDLEEALIVRVN
jgi:hypothetical protein